MVHHRVTEQELNRDLSHYFGLEIKVEPGEKPGDDWQGDDFYTFGVDDSEVGGYFDVYYLKTNRPGYIYITEIIICFES